MGVQRRSSPICQRAIDLIRGGAIGKVTACRVFHIRNEWPMGIGDPKDSEPPKELDWNMWLGPAPKVPYNENRCFYKFRWFPPYSGGQLTNMGTHYLDMIQWALGQDAPTGIFATGGQYAVEDNREIPDTMQVVWEYPGKTLVTFTHFDANDAPGSPKPSDLEFRGTKGTLYLIGHNIEIVPTQVRTAPIPSLDPTDRRRQVEQSKKTAPGCEPLLEKGRVETDDHARNFLDCVVTREPCNCPVEVGHRSTTATLLATVAHRLNRYLKWDPEAQQFINDAEANALLNYEYRSPWKLTV
jgi:predicted dehydrogenase